MERAIVILRGVAVAGFLVGVAFMVMPANTAVDSIEAPASVADPLMPVASGAIADSLAEDIILYNLFTPSRTPPSRRSQVVGAPDEQPMRDDVMASSSGFSPELIGTAVSATPGATRALLRLTPSDAAPRLYAVGDRAGGYQVVSIDPRSVVLNGPRGRIVLRLPQDEENHS